jgi:hypothetical protein
MLTNWGYGICENAGSENRRDYRIVARTTKGNFIKMASEHFCNANYIRQRVAETGNEFEISLLNNYPLHTLLKYDTQSKQIVSMSQYSTKSLERFKKAKITA